MKKLLATLLVILMLPVTTALATEVAVNIPAFKVTFNNTEVENDYRAYPLIVYKDITYVPMTYFDCRYLGLSTDWDGETNSLTIEKSLVTCAYRNYEWEWKNAVNNKATVCDFNIIVNGKEIENSKEEYPLLTFRDVTYFPLTWRFAVDEFEWEYSFDSEKGLVIISDNKHAENIYLPNIAGSAATDGEYYYYNGDNGDKHVVYRAPVNDTTKTEVIFEHPESGMSQRVRFTESEGEVYFYYTVGNSPVMSSTYVRKIHSDGTLTDVTPASYSYSAHGYSEKSIRKNGIFLKAVNPYVDSATEFSYEIDGVETKVSPLPGRVRLGWRRDGKADTSYESNYMQIFGDKIYYVANNLDTKDDSALYCIDTKTAQTVKLIDGVCGFYVYTGWVNELQADSTMILYDNNGTLMRYTELNDSVKQIEQKGDEGMILIGAAGEYEVVTVQKSIDGRKTMVKAFDCYASGSGSIKGTVYETTTGASFEKEGNYLCVYTLGESSDDEIRIAVPRIYYSSDVAESVFICNDTLLYKLWGEDVLVKVDLKS